MNLAAEDPKPSDGGRECADFALQKSKSDESAAAMGAIDEASQAGTATLSGHPFPQATHPSDLMNSWNESLETGHPTVDAEHRELIRQLEGVSMAVEAGAGLANVTELIVILQRYAHGHFSREEAHMLRVSCPAHGANCIAHREFSARLDRWLELLTQRGTPMSLILDVQRESVAWIRQHITRIDCQLRHCALR